MRPLSLRTRLTLVYLVGVIVTLATVFVVLQQGLRSRLMGSLDQELRRGTAAARVVALDRGLSDPADLTRTLNNVSPVELAGAPFLVVVRDRDGRALASAPAGLGEVVELLPPGSRTYRAPDHLDLRVYTEALPGGGWVQAAETLDSINGPLDELRVAMAITSGAALPLVALLAFLLAGRGLRPLEEVVAFAGQVRAGDLRRRLRSGRRPPEVQRLADAFDAMLARLEAAFAQQRRFVGDVSHELRTPLTALRGGIDVLLMQPDLTPEAREQLDEMSAECARLVRLTQNLLGLAQAETGRIPTAQPVEMDRVCIEAIIQTGAVRPDVTVDMGRFVPLTVTGDADLLLQMVLNLLENAALVSPEGGRVTLSLARDDERAVIRVADTGPGIAAEDLPHIFERFYSGRARRSRGGMGLGLAIVRWIAIAHGGDVAAANRPAGGALFTVTLPLARTPPARATAPAETAAGHLPA